jgi:hypothetical protein
VCVSERVTECAASSFSAWPQLNGRLALLRDPQSSAAVVVDQKQQTTTTTNNIFMV